MCARSVTLDDSLSTPGTAAQQAPLSRRLSREEHFLLQGILPTQGIKLASPTSPALAGGFFTTVSPEKPRQVTAFLVN